MGCLLYWKRKKEYVDIQRLNHRHTVSWDPGVTDYRPLAVCYDCLCLISLLCLCPIIGTECLVGLDTMSDMTVPLLGHYDISRGVCTLRWLWIG